MLYCPLRSPFSLAHFRIRIQSIAGAAANPLTMTTSRMAALSTPHSASILSRARWVTRLQFMGLGVLAGTWGAHIPSVRTHYALSEATLSMVLLAAAIGAVGSLFVAGRIVGSLGARSATALAALGWRAWRSASCWSLRAWSRCCR